jgi:hypothetical protein
VGLSYKFNSYKVLEKRDIEFHGKDKNGKDKEFIFYEEFRNLNEGQIIISIEHW